MKEYRDEDNLYELVTMDDELTCLPPYACCKEFIKEKMVKIPCQKPDVEQLAKILIKPKITSYRRICTYEGRKLIVQGEIIEKVFYVAQNCQQTVHCANFSFPFCNFIKLGGKRGIKDIRVQIEDVILQLERRRRINQSILMIICAIPYVEC